MTNAFKPVVNRRKTGEVDALALMGIHPRPAGDIGDTVVVAAQPGALAKAPVEHAVQPLSFNLIALDGIGYRLGGAVVKVVVLPEHRP